MFLPKIEKQIKDIGSCEKEIIFFFDFDAPPGLKGKDGGYEKKDKQIYINLSLCVGDLKREIVIRHELDHSVQATTNQFVMDQDLISIGGWFTFLQLVNDRIRGEGHEELSFGRLMGYFLSREEFEVWCRDYLHFCWRKNICPEDFETVRQDPESSILGCFPSIMEGLDNLEHFEPTDLKRGWLIKEIKNLWW